ncbi:hypothetical protein PINS_up024105 [Pythium insidiosum]|nr:hypothetical protein PINS_up024105 [Pythium insidiosum]
MMHRSALRTRQLCVRLATKRHCLRAGNTPRAVARVPHDRWRRCDAVIARRRAPPLPQHARRRGPEARFLRRARRLARTPAKQEIKKKYYQLGQKYHPDTNKDDPEAAKSLPKRRRRGRCWADDDKRSKYDTFGHAGVDPNGFGGGGGPGDFQGFEDIFGDFASSDWPTRPSAVAAAAPTRRSAEPISR